MNNIDTWLSLIISFFALAFSVATFCAGLCRQRRQNTLDAFNTLQSQALDKLYGYTQKRITEIAQDTHSEEYKELTQILVRCQHFAVGVNTRIYSVRVLRRLTNERFFGASKKLQPLIQKKRELGHSDKYYEEFEMMCAKLKRNKTPIVKRERAAKR